ncbi:Ferredoxin-thioredoxin reductase subunit A1 [Cardamine amara subsp. amara]|uniref:Ferredoxin-thioredoxin reductase subunit A1 n=1 Tax=Cardamine amara subsp. amara TaxID=228776 RepID=A0ABD1A2R7_CARAN
MSSPIAMSPAIVAAVRPPASHDCLSSATAPTSLKSCIVTPLSLLASQSRIKHTSSTRTSRLTTIRCDVAVKSADSVNAEANPSSSPSSEEEIEAEAKAKIGSRVKVTAPLKVYHVNRVPEVDLEGMEGKFKDYVAVWKGKRISANLPYKVEFFKEIEGRGLVKFVSHLKEDEFEFIDP